MYPVDEFGQELASAQLGLLFKRGKLTVTAAAAMK